MAATSTRAGAGRNTTGEEPFGPGDVTPGLAAGTRDRQRRQASSRRHMRTPSDAEVMRQADEAQRPPEAAQQPEPPRDGRRPPASRPPSGPRTRTGGGGSSFTMTDQGAGFILGMVAYALFINYLRYGWSGVTGWLSAKFLNQVTLGTGASTGGGITPSSNSQGQSPTDQASGANSLSPVTSGGQLTPYGQAQGVKTQ